MTCQCERPWRDGLETHFFGEDACRLPDPVLAASARENEKNAISRVVTADSNTAIGFLALKNPTTGRDNRAVASTQHNQEARRMKLKLPSLATTILALLGGMLVVINNEVLGLPTVWHNGINVALTLLTAFAISPVTGRQFLAAIHVTQAQAASIGSALVALQIALTTFDLSSGVKTVLQAIVVIAAGLGFGPDTPQELELARARQV